MSIIFKLSIPLLLICTSYSTFAAVFKCEENGNVTFSDTPCNGDAKDITDQHLKTTPKTTTTTTFDTEKIKKKADEMESSRIKREIKRDISTLEKQIDQIIKKRDSELLTLKNQKESLGYGDDYDDELRVIELKKSISDEMSALSSQYSAEIDKLNEKIKNLRQQLMTKKQKAAE